MDKPVILIFGNNATVFISDVLVQGFGTFGDSTVLPRRRKKDALVRIDVAQMHISEYHNNADLKKWIFFIAAVLLVFIVVIVVIVVKVTGVFLNTFTQYLLKIMREAIE